jgi:hypothetical protein
VQNTLPVWIAPEDVLVENAHVLRLPPRAERPTVGMGPAVKRDHDRTQLYVVPLVHEVEQRRHGRSTAVLYLDGATEYRVLVEVLYPLGQSETVDFILATELPAETKPNRARGRQSPPHDLGFR